MRILVFGNTGQVGMELRHADGVVSLDRSQADLGDPAECAKIIALSDADVIINAAAYTAVDKAESDSAQVRVINCDAPTAMAVAAAERKIPFIHISTDYVFDGSGNQPWRESDMTGPLGVYGATKLAGEKGILDAGGTFAILRTSWVFSAHGSNFVKTMLRLGRERERLTVVNDQIGGPTPARDIASTCLTIADRLYNRRGPSGIYHYAGAPDVSWADFSRAIFDAAGLDVEVAEIPTSSFPTPARRPANSRLDCTRIHEAFSVCRPDWHAGLRAALTELKVI